MAWCTLMQLRPLFILYVYIFYFINFILYIYFISIFYIYIASNLIIPPKPGKMHFDAIEASIYFLQPVKNTSFWAPKVKIYLPQFSWHILGYFMKETNFPIDSNQNQLNPSKLDQANVFRSWEKSPSGRFLNMLLIWFYWKARSPPQPAGCYVLLWAMP